MTKKTGKKAGRGEGINIPYAGVSVDDIEAAPQEQADAPPSYATLSPSYTALSVDDDAPGRESQQKNETTPGESDTSQGVVLSIHPPKDAAATLGFDDGEEQHEAVQRKELQRLGAELAATRSQRIKNRLQLLAEVQTHKLLKSRFSAYTRNELILLLVRHNCEIRAEELVHTTTLRDLAEKLYSDTEMPKPAAYPVNAANKVMLERGFGTLQRRFIHNAHAKRAAMLREHDKEHRLHDYEENVDYMVHPGEDQEGQERGGDDGDGDTESPHPQTVRKFMRYLDVPWKAPDWELARIYENFSKPRQFGKGNNNPKFDYWKTTTGRHCFHGGCGEQLDFWGEGQVSEFGLYGAATTCYFKFIKYLFWLFLILSILSLPALILNVYGPNAGKTNSLGDLSITSVGNLAASAYNQTVVVRVPGCYEGGYYVIDCNMSKERVGLFYAWLDIIIIGVLCVSFVWLRVFEAREEWSLNKYTVSASMFTVMVEGLPAECNELEVRRHLKSCMLQRNFSKPVIMHVNLGYDNEDLIREASLRGSILREKIDLTEKHRYDCTKIKTNASLSDKVKEDKLTALRKAYLSSAVKFSAALKARETRFVRMSEVTERPIAAFITFNDIVDAINCVRCFHSMTWGEFCRGGAPELLLKGSKLTIFRAPEPSTIIWENLKYTQWQRFWRRTLTSWTCTMILLLSIMICFGAKTVQEQVKTAGGSDLCPSAFNTKSAAEKQAFVNTPGNEKYLHCYCSTLSYAQRATDSTCTTYYTDVSRAEAITFFAAVVVLFVNSAMEFAVRYLVDRFDKHRTEDTRNRAIFVRIFLLKYINTR